MWAELSGVWQNCFLPTKGACHGLWITVTVFLMFISYRAHTFFYLTSLSIFLLMQLTGKEWRQELEVSECSQSVFSCQP